MDARRALEIAGNCRNHAHRANALVEAKKNYDETVAQSEADRQEVIKSAVREYPIRDDAATVMFINGALWAFGFDPLRSMEYEAALHHVVPPVAPDNPPCDPMPEEYGEGA